MKTTQEILHFQNNKMQDKEEKLPEQERLKMMFCIGAANKAWDGHCVTEIGFKFILLILVITFVFMMSTCALEGRLYPSTVHDY